MPRHDRQRPRGSRVEHTFDGKRVRMDELNLPSEPRRGGPFQRLRRNLALFLAGMYTGESCAGTPHSERRSKPGNNSH